MPQLTCGRLKSKTGNWRVDGIGLIRANKSLGTRINYLFSDIDPNFLGSPYSLKANTGSTYELVGHPSWLRHFTPGSIWQEGQKIIVPQTLSEPVTIDTEQCIYTRPNAIPYDFAPLETLLPQSHLNFGENLNHLNQTLFALIKKPSANGPKLDYLIIPTSELFRFYVGASSRLLSNALTGRLSELIGDARLVDGEAIIHDLTGTLTRREALFYGRTLVSNEARETFFGPYKHLVTAGLLNQVAEPLYINSRFPFTGKTTLHVAGKRVKLINLVTLSEEWALVVNQIHNCSHMLGFQKLSLIRSEARIRDSNTAGYKRPARSIKTDPEVPIELNDSPADRLTGTLITTSQATSLFNQIKSINFRIEAAEMDEFDKCAREANSESTGNTFEDAQAEARGAGNQQVEEVDATTSAPERNIKLFLQMLQFLRIKTAQYEWDIKTLPLHENKIVDGETITEFPTLGRRFTWYKIFLDAHDKGRPREIIWAQIKIGEKFIHLIEMELRPNENSSSVLAVLPKKNGNVFHKFIDDNLKDLLVLTAVHNGWPPENKNWKPQYKDAAAQLSNCFDFIHFNHPYTRPSKSVQSEEDNGNLTSTEEENYQETQTNAESWAKDILEKINTLGY